MRLRGRLWKSGAQWLAEVPALDAMTQGRARADVVRMLEDLVATMADAPAANRVRSLVPGGATRSGGE